MAKNKKYEEDEYIEEEAYEEDAPLEDEEEQYVDEKSARRVIRRKRRIRNQMIAWLVLIVLVVAVLAGAGFGLTKLIQPGSTSSGAGETSGEASAAGDYDGGLIQIQAPEIALHYPEGSDDQGSVEDTPDVNPLDEYAMNYISQMSLEEKVAGLFFVTPESMMDGVDQAVVAGGKTEAAMAEYAVGGIIYTTKNIQSVEQITQMLEKTTALSKYPIFLGAQEEGGSVAKVSDALSDAPKIGKASDMGATGDATTAYNSYAQVAQYMKKLGFNVDFAPNGMVSASSLAFAADADTVASYLYQAISGLEDNKVSAAAVGFPGMGSADATPTDGRSTVALGMDALEISDLLPYKMAVNAGVDMVMVNQASYPEIVGDYTPASMSSAIVNDLLRAQMGYKGLVITEPMNVKAVTEYYTSAEAAIAALNAGCDMILMPENFKEAYAGVLAAAQNGEISESRIEESLLRIYRIKLLY